MRRFYRRPVRKILHALGVEITRSRTWKISILRYNPNSFGVNPFSDIKRLISESKRTIVFDVGANIGGTVEHLKDRIPQSEIHAFEPNPTTYELLIQNTNSYRDIHLNRLGVGALCETKSFLENSCSVMSSFLKPSTTCTGRIINDIPVEVVTLDHYCVEKNIPYINLLKSDTQGYDLEVLKGGEALMGSNRIQMVLIEIIFTDMYQGIPPLDEIFRFLLNRNFVLVSFYDFNYKNNVAGWCDALFINPKFGSDNRSNEMRECTR